MEQALGYPEDGFPKGGLSQALPFPRKSPEDAASRSLFYLQPPPSRRASRQILATGSHAVPGVRGGQIAEEPGEPGEPGEAGEAAAETSFTNEFTNAFPTANQRLNEAAPPPPHTICVWSLCGGLVIVALAIVLPRRSLLLYLRPTPSPNRDGLGASRSTHMIDSDMVASLGRARSSKQEDGDDYVALDVAASADHRVSWRQRSVSHPPPLRLQRSEEQHPTSPPRQLDSCAWCNAPSEPNVTGDLFFANDRVFCSAQCRSSELRHSVSEGCVAQDGSIDEPAMRRITTSQLSLAELCRA